MRTHSILTSRVATFLILLSGLFLTARDAQAHCDTMNGPVVLDAKKALETGDIELVLKWVAPDDEAEIRASFDRTLSVRGISAEARELADMYFFETVVRLHRMSEGVGYTGLKPATSVDPAIAAADGALETGSVDALSDKLIEELRVEMSERFDHAYRARSSAANSVEAGREFVRAYVRYTHFVEAIDALAQGQAGQHGIGHEGLESTAHTH